jgi:hypothetical protein
MVEDHVPRSRWEVEFFDHGEIEVEQFESNGGVRDESALDELRIWFD